MTIHPTILTTTLLLLLLHQSNATPDVDNVPNNNSTTDSDIRGGIPSPAISYYGAFQSAGLCGVSLIHGDIALTAAHCVDESLPSSIRFNSEDRSSGGETAQITQRILHPLYTGNILSADLAILKLDRFLFLEPAILNNNPYLPGIEGEGMLAAGFGLTGDGGGTSQILRSTIIPYLENCEQKFDYFENFRMICGDSTASATCGGDSGSPIMLEGTNIQIGINSWSDGGCDDQTIDAYTRVSYYYDWILEQVCENSEYPPFDFECPTRSPSAPSTAPTLRPISPPSCVIEPGRGFLRGVVRGIFGW